MNMSIMVKQLLWLVPLVVGVVTAICAVIAAFKGLTEMRQNRAQREGDLRWRQAKEAKGLLDELWKNPLARNAMYLLDNWVSGRRCDVDGEPTTINGEVVRQALNVRVKPGSRGLTPLEQYIRDCFDAFFDHVYWVAHFSGAGLVRLEDVKDPLEGYVGLLGKHVPTEAHQFVTDFHPAKVRTLLLEFAAWREAMAEHAPPSKGTT